MIVREITKEPFKQIHKFDWFNDYEDTRRFLERCGNQQTLLAFLDAGHKLWLNARIENFQPIDSKQ